MSHILVQKALFQLINRLFRLVGSLFEAGPGAHGQGNMVALAAGQPALAGLHAGELLEFAVKLLNLPADAAFLLSGGRVVWLDLVGEEVSPSGGWTPVRSNVSTCNPSTFPSLSIFYLLLLRRPTSSAGRRARTAAGHRIRRRGDCFSGDSSIFSLRRSAI